MAKVLIVSDSHGLKKELEELKNRHQHEVDLMVHCGDSELTLNDKEIANFAIVKGNCDNEAGFKHEILKELEGYRIYVTHGHRFSVKTSLMKLLYRSEEVNAKIICFGHSHILGAEMVRNKLFLNPGSLRNPRMRRERTYLILDLFPGRANVHVYDFDHGELKDLQQSFSFQEK